MTPAEVLAGLRGTYKLHTTALTYGNEWQLLVAIILSAQCTDARVNLVTPVLFKEIPTVKAMSKARLATIEKLIHSTGFYKAKARNIKGAAQRIVADFKGRIPSTMTELITIPGVGRKTANVFLGVVHNKAEGVVVDTHIYRVSRRTGVSRASSAEGVERDIMQTLPQRQWIAYGDLVIQHGRQICHARKPNCAACPLQTQCPSAVRI